MTDIHIPQDRARNHGGDEFLSGGAKFAETFEMFGGLKGSDRVLDIGCGAGRMAIGIGERYGWTNRLTGFDIIKVDVDVCRQGITGRHPNFQFHHVDAWNGHYNSEGTVQPHEVVFPAADGSIDFAFATSVFTHMFRREVAHYLAECLRVLRPGGTLLGVYIAASLKNVVWALSETLVLVLIVIFLFLGTLRATLIPAVTIPVSIIAAGIVMLMLDYSINTLTLLAAVLAIGLVVDDAIVVLENIVRRIENGENAVLASINGSREIGFAVIATTLVLMAVFVPVSFMTGDTGRLFGEFGDRGRGRGFLRVHRAESHTHDGVQTVRQWHPAIQGRRRRGQDVPQPRRPLRRGPAQAAPRPASAVDRRRGAGAVRPGHDVAGGGFPFSGLRIASELAPQEDRAMIRIFVTAPGRIEHRLSRPPASTGGSHLDGRSRERQCASREHPQRWLRPQCGLRHRHGDPAVESLGPARRERRRHRRSPASRDPGHHRRARQRQPVGSPLTRNSTRPLAIAMGGGDYAEIVQWRDKVMQRVAQENPRILNLESDYLERQPRVIVQIDRNKAADLGVSLQTVGRTLETMMGSRIVTTFERSGEEYDVMLQARETQRASVGDLDNLYVRSDKNNGLIPLSALVRIEERAGPTELRRTDRMRAIELAGSLAPGYTLGEAVAYLERVIHEEAPNAQIIYNGETYQYKKSGDALWVTFAFALLVVYLVLAAQFESFIHPLVILVTVPLALTGALLGLFLFNSTINIFSQIGCIMLIGIACKNGILIVEFANQLRDRGVEFVDAVIQASATRLRPVLMTSLCTAFGAVPLMIAHGAGAESRESIGATVFFGTIVSLGMTLYVVPALYLLIARNTRSPEYMTRLIESLKGRREGARGAVTTSASASSNVP